MEECQDESEPKDLVVAFSAFPNMPGDTGGTLGRAGTAAVAGNTVVVKDLFETLRKF